MVTSSGHTVPRTQEPAAAFLLHGAPLLAAGSANAMRPMMCMTAIAAQNMSHDARADTAL